MASAAECEQAFYEALENADADAIAELWLDDDEVCCVHPGGPRLVGHAAIRASWAAILANGPLRIRAIHRKTVDSPSLAIHNVIEEVVVPQGRSQQVVQVLATNAYVKTASGWKMVLHHACPAPADQPTEVESVHGPLH